tara:strand:- start:72 stop:203 length:132 start_codon:yes stop_codon:yes gene_type:complete
MGRERATRQKAMADGPASPNRTKIGEDPRHHAPKIIANNAIRL